MEATVAWSLLSETVERFATLPYQCDTVYSAAYFPSDVITRISIISILQVGGQGIIRLRANASD